MSFEWRTNRMFPAVYDLYHDGIYAHAWVTQERGEDTWKALAFELVHGQKLRGKYPTIHEAQDAVIAYLVERRLDGASRPDRNLA